MWSFRKDKEGNRYRSLRSSRECRFTRVPLSPQYSELDNRRDLFCYRPKEKYHLQLKFVIVNNEPANKRINVTYHNFWFLQSISDNGLRQDISGP